MSDVMTYPEFLEALNKTDGWYLELDGAIRRGDKSGLLVEKDKQCPLMAVLGDHVYDQSYSRAVWNAADNWKDYHDFEKMRLQLLAACHLEEVGPTVVMKDPAFQCPHENT